MHVRIALAGALAFTLMLGLVAAVPLAPPRALPSASPSASPIARQTPSPLLGPSPEPAVRSGSSARARVGPLRIPIAGGSIPEEAALLPGSPRDYRAGIHEGIDFPADAGTPVLAAAAGRVVRADLVFIDWSAAERRAALAQALALGRTSEATLDRIRGRQVWIDHGRGVVTRYSHLERVTVAEGEELRSGAVIGAVGSSGLPEGGPHLHLEIRIGDSYLGEDLTPAQLARALRAAFP